MVKKLLSHEKIQPNITNRSGHTALMTAVSEGNENMVEELLSSNKIDPNILDQNGRSALFASVLNNNLGIMKKLLMHEKTNANTQDEHGITALTEAIILQNTSLVMELLSHDKVDHTVSDGYNNTTLMHAVMGGNSEILNVLIKNRYYNNINEQSITGYTALLHAIEYPGSDQKSAELVSILHTNYQHSIDANLTDEHAWTALMIASADNKAQTVSALLKFKNININQQNSLGESALLLSLNHDDGNVLDHLLEDSNIDPNIMRINGECALSISANKGQKANTTKLLIHEKTTRLSDEQISRLTSTGNETYQSQLGQLKKKRRLRFTGILKSVNMFKKSRLEASKTTYKPGGKGYLAAEMDFNQRAASSMDDYPTKTQAKP